MGIEVIGMVSTRPGSEMDGPSASIMGGYVDPAFLTTFAQAHERSGFDRVLIGYTSTGPDGFAVANYAASVTEKLGFLLAHRPGFVAPTLAARQIATLDHFSGGRIAVHIITGGSDDEQQQDGDRLDHDGRYRRTDEYLEIVRRVWTSDAPVDYAGEFYTVSRAASEVKPLQQPYVPIYFGGASAVAVEVGAKHCDVYMGWGEPLAEVRKRVAAVNEAAARHGRRPGFSVSVRPILGPTTEKAWARAHAILDRILTVRGGAPDKRPEDVQAEGSRRLLELAAKGELYDTCLWTPIATAVGAYGNTTALVGTPETVAGALADYHDAGATTVLIRGFEPLPDAIDYGRDLIPLLRQEVAHRERQAAVAAGR